MIPVPIMRVRVQKMRAIHRERRMPVRMHGGRACRRVRTGRTHPIRKWAGGPGRGPRRVVGCRRWRPFLDAYSARRERQTREHTHGSEDAAQCEAQRLAVG